MVIVWLNRHTVRLPSKYLSFDPQVRQLSAPITETSFFSGWQLLWRQLVKEHCGLLIPKCGNYINPLLKRLREHLERREGKIVRASGCCLCLLGVTEPLHQGAH